MLGWLEGVLAAVVGGEIKIEDLFPLSDAWYDIGRRQYQGSKILRALERLSYPQHDQVLGLVDADYYAPGLNFIFGQTATYTGVAFIALPRLREAFYGR